MENNFNGKMCPCSSGIIFEECCGDIILGKKLAPNPLALMRSRYVAHVLKNMEYILKTMRGVASHDPYREERFKGCKWIKLEIIDAPQVALDDKFGIVEFKAHYTLYGKNHIMHERSEFLKVDHQWYYLPKN